MDSVARSLEDVVGRGGGEGGGHAVAALQLAEEFTATRPTTLREHKNAFCARVAILETVFVSTVLHLGRLSGTSDQRPSSRSEADPPGYSFHSSASWAQWDQVILQDWFAKRCPMLKTCPFFMRGRLRQCLAVALRERSRAKDGSSP